MRIWMVNQWAVPPSQPGGTRHHTLARELIERGHEVAIIAAGFSYFNRAEVRLFPGETCRREVMQGVPFLWLRTPPYHQHALERVLNMAAFAGQVWMSTAMRTLGKPDVIIGSSPSPLAALAAERLAGRLRVPFVLEVRDIWPQSLVDLGGLPARHPMTQCLEWLERYLYRRAQRIVSLLPKAVEHIAARGGSRERVVWIPNGVDLGQAPPPLPPPAGDALTVMYAGAHGLANGLDTVLDAAAILQQESAPGRVRFLLVGNGPEKPRLQRRAERESLSVDFREPVSKGEVYRVLQQAHLFLMVLRDSPVFRWGISPNKLFDYLAAARPVVFSVGSPFNPVAEAGAGLTVPAENALAMADAIRQLAAMPEADRWEMGLRGRRYVEENHNFARLADRLEHLLAEVVEERDA